MRIPRAGCISLGLALLTFTAACGDDDDSESAATTSATAEAITTTTENAQVHAAAAITHEGFGAIKIGMTLEEAQAAAGDGATYEAAQPDEDYACGDLTIGVPDMFVTLVPGDDPNDLRVRYIVSLNPDVKTDTGIGLGSTVADVRAKYPNAEPGADQQATALIVAGTPGELAFRVDTGFGEPIPDETEITGIAITDPAIAESDEYCA